MVDHAYHEFINAKMFWHALRADLQCMLYLAHPNLKGLAMPMKSIVTENIFKFTMCTASKRLYSTCNLWRHCTDMYNILKWIEDI